MINAIILLAYFCAGLFVLMILAAIADWIEKKL